MAISLASGENANTDTGPTCPSKTTDRVAVRRSYITEAPSNVPTANFCALLLKSTEGYLVENTIRIRSKHNQLYIRFY